MSRRAPGPVPRLEHHTLERLETIWLGMAVVIAVLLFASVLTSFLSGTTPSLSGDGAHHLAGVKNGRLDPKNLAATPFATPGLRENADGSLEAFVVARAFNFEPAVLRVPAGRPVTFHVTSADVMHGYLIEGTNINVNVVPGQVASFTTTFRSAGTHDTVCNEYCGVGHHNMLGRVVVEAAQP
ncbi:cytochrome c oxidase subunit II [Deinococcus multiflagellatus]|uniref:Cytochrome c oxidase subunit II n=1 Tax=Deinococcus multiflagellatus TaxID=1656887 RepID=A0ABW1ZUL2_9DEIO|nr:cytochrome c oxidase subunit II [Deinococcus multiflagellatus]MBZ9713585.1 cytochrome c oxidase subunit II [Deinococcus multiflagellatus]